MPSKKLALPALILASIIGGTGPIALKFALTSLPPFTILFFRFLIGTVLIFPLILRTNFDFRSSLTKRTLILSLFFTGNVVLFIIGIRYTTAITTGLLYTLPTIIITLLTKIRRKHEPISLLQFIGLGVSLIGVLFILIRSFTSTPQSLKSIGTPLGNSIILLAVISYSLYLYLSQPLSRHHSPLHLTFINFLAATAISFVLFTWEILSIPSLPHPSPISLISLLYVSLAVSVGMYLLYLWGIKHSSTFTAATTFYLSPLVTTILALPLLGERLTPHLIFGGLTILTGVFLSQPRRPTLT